MPSSSEKRRIAVVTMGVKLGEEVKGYTRFLTIAQMLSDVGFDVDLITSSFQHWEKAQRNTADAAYGSYAFNVVFIDEPGYSKNLDLKRIWSHHVASKRLRSYLEDQFGPSNVPYSLIYAEIPPNDVARVCGEVAQQHGIPFVVDVNDLWPEAMRMAIDVPVISDIAFFPFSRDAKRTYESISASVGTSDEYAARPNADRDVPVEELTVYVGNDIDAFDEGASSNSPCISKCEGEVWVTYAGTLGASYDIDTLIRASALARARLGEMGWDVRVKLLGDGPDRATLESTIEEMSAPVDVLGYTPYDQMAAWLCESDILVNSLVKAAPQSIVTKIGDYLAAGKPMINTGSSPEFRAKVEAEGFGVNVPAEDAEALADAIVELASDHDLRDAMGARARKVAEEQFDRKSSYTAIVQLVDRLTGDSE